jgi:light-regulated signal transduction histidine kinase (bacteriophytochrome)
MSHAIAHLETSIQNSQAIVNSQQFTRRQGNKSSMSAVISYFKNGIKYRSQDTPIIYISAVSQDNEWLFSVRDNGIEIAPRCSRQISQIF